MSDTAHHAFQELFRTKKRLKAAKGQLVCTPDEEPKGIFYIHSGYVKAYDIDATGCNQIIALYGPGELFPLSWALKSDGPKLFYEAISQLAFSLCSRHEFSEVIHENVRLLQAVITSLLQTYQHLQQRVQNLELKTARQKVIYRLLFLGTRFGHRTGDTITITMPLRYQDLAESLNMNRDTVNRVMRELIAEGRIIRSSRYMLIKHTDSLADTLGAETTLEF